MAVKCLARLVLMCLLLISFATSALAQCTGWGKDVSPLLRPMTQAEIDALNAKLDLAGTHGFDFTNGRPGDTPPPGGPPKPRLYTTSRRDWRRVSVLLDTPDGTTVPAPSNPDDGVPEIVLDPGITDPDTDPGDAASVVSHEMGHVKNPDAKDKLPDKTADEEGQKKHFLIYKDELKELCDYLTYVKACEICIWESTRCETCKK